MCERYGTAACLDPNWAEWPVPNNTYVNNADGTVTDNTSKLMWEQSSSYETTTQMSYSDSVSYCENLRTGGYSDWRVPTMIELVSLMNFGTYLPAIDISKFTNTLTEGHYWSSTPLAQSPTDHWLANFGYGGTVLYAPGGQLAVRCVR
ncbi:MAG: DUF1566 domain-containing protein [Deltaproteobacteria bacterium]|nr:DUF1566 domain-containing protein [Deltaproteobacteria bacterium]